MRTRRACGHKYEKMSVVIRPHGARSLVLVCAAACSFEPGESVQRDAPTDPPVIDALMAPPVDARDCPVAPTGCTVFTCASTSSCYYECGTTGTTKASWDGAVQACTNASLGCLITINDQMEQDCVVQHAVPTFVTYLWFGYHQTATTAEPLGNWNWQCGTSSYVQPGWGTGFEPNDFGGNEDCAAMSGNGGWFDANCTGTARYVCELP